MSLQRFSSTPSAASKVRMQLTSAPEAAHHSAMHHSGSAWFTSTPTRRLNAVRGPALHGQEQRHFCMFVACALFCNYMRTRTYCSTQYVFN